VSIIFIILACSSPFMQTNIGEGKKSDPLALARPPSWPTGPPGTSLGHPPSLGGGTCTRADVAERMSATDDWRVDITFFPPIDR
jgi:hypothetical protein